VASVLAAVSGLEAPWVYIFAAGVFVVVLGITIAGVRFVIPFLPTKWQRAIRERPTPKSAALPSFPPFLLPKTPKQQLTDLIEEGANLLARIPERAQDPRGRLVESLTGATVDYLVLVYEWEARVWRMMSSAGLRQLRGLYAGRPSPQRWAALREHLADRIAELRTILANA
jgi:hypothetical protein